ncbi:hypothetical protein D1Z90_07485 [Motilimonas pumila]|uniref:Uncharacterized protein n=1 Tax=Motilimonas pumila TaxID=2303987 RepID=A0A418YGK0_9GAMM|nr:hypothetical protein D1Z90_07485 [Motilimonas pumila]
MLVTIDVRSNPLIVARSCPVTFQGHDIGRLDFSKPWYHSGRENASYIPKDNATGVGLEIHFFSNQKGSVQQQNLARCDKYRILQIRSTNIRHLANEQAVQVDVPPDFHEPFYDNAPLEHGYGDHFTPKDSRDKPWSKPVKRASTVAIYDTPYVSDFYGTEGEDMIVMFETCVVCQREQQFDSILSCGNWGYVREYLGGMTGWTEPEFIESQCQAKPSSVFNHTLDTQQRIEYSYYLNWRDF